MHSTRPGALVVLLVALVVSAFSLLIPTTLLIADPGLFSTPSAAGVRVVGDAHDAQVSAVCTTTVWSLAMAACLCSLFLPRHWGLRALLAVGAVSAGATVVSALVPGAGRTGWHIASLALVGTFALLGRLDERRTPS